VEAPRAVLVAPTGVSERSPAAVTSATDLFRQRSESPALLRRVLSDGERCGAALGKGPKSSIVPPENDAYLR
jgi:hypothetical protein